MMTSQQLSSLSLLDKLKLWASKGVIRQLDYQFARFVYSQTEDQELALLAGTLSAEVGRGHVCLPLFSSKGEPADLAAKLGIYGDAATELHAQIQQVDWRQKLLASSFIGAGGEALPMMFDGKRLYLQRYWHYEVALASTLNNLGQEIEFSADELSELSKVLDHLFAREYSYLFSALQTSKNATAVVRQRLVCDMLDVVEQAGLDWAEIDRVLLTAKNSTDLEMLNSLVPNSVCVNWQRVAAAVALTRRFAVISGGPGTGKTTTVTKLLAALITQGKRATGAVPSIRLVAPTGKAAARLTESIGQAVTNLPVDTEMKDSIPTDASTVHRLLGALPNSAEFRHNRHNPLHLDILVVDEASMVDLSLMYKLVDALPKHARLILLGDKDQLASVEAGAVLGDICSFHTQGFSSSQASLVSQLTGFTTLNQINQVSSPIADSLCMLQKSYRFDARSGIGQLAKAVNSGSLAKIESIWNKGFEDINHYSIDSQNYSLLVQTLVTEYKVYLKQMSRPFSEVEAQGDEIAKLIAKGALKAFGNCRLLCAIREGDFGVTGLNTRIEKALTARKLIQVQDELWYHGRPIMVTRNDHALGLYNGDIGLCMRDSEGEDARLKVYFELPDGTIKAVLPSRVPEHETAYAMTIHKSQGSEFSHTLMILPPDFTPILNRELIYTGITRAKNRLSLFAEVSVMQRGVRVTTSRASGLVDRL